MFTLNWCQFEVCGLSGGLAMLNIGVTYLQTIHKDLEKEEPVVKSTLAHAEELLGTSNQSKKVEKDQQYQKLRYNTSDLKVRFDAVSTFLFINLFFFFCCLIICSTFICVIYSSYQKEIFSFHVCAVYQCCANVHVSCTKHLLKKCENVCMLWREQLLATWMP